MRGEKIHLTMLRSCEECWRALQLLSKRYWKSIRYAAQDSVVGPWSEGTTLSFPFDPITASSCFQEKHTLWHSPLKLYLICMLSRWPRPCGVAETCLCFYQLVLVFVSSGRYSSSSAALNRFWGYIWENFDVQWLYSYRDNSLYQTDQSPSRKNWKWNRGRLIYANYF